jgi:hypothetical protein
VRKLQFPAVSVEIVVDLCNDYSKLSFSATCVKIVVCFLNLLFTILKCVHKLGDRQMLEMWEKTKQCNHKMST